MKTSKLLNGMTDDELLDFVLIHPVAGGCGTTSATDAAVADQTKFTTAMVSQAHEVFGADSGVFNTMKNAYSALLAAGPSQQGFSVAQQNAMNAAAITNGANQARFAQASLAGRQAGAGGGNAPNASGIGAGASTQLAADIAAQTAGSLNQIQQKNWEQGNINWREAGAELGKAPGVFNNMGEFNRAAQTGLDKNMSNATAADAASNWWVKPVEAIGAAGLNMVAPGVGSMAFSAMNPSGGSSGGGLLSRLKNPFGGGGGITDAGNPQYMPGGGPDVSAPQGAFPGSVPGS
jgi:hypothetical protein